MFVFRYSAIIELQHEINAASFAECSALTGPNVVEIFERAARIVVANREKDKKKSKSDVQIFKWCSIM